MRLGDKAHCAGPSLDRVNRIFNRFADDIEGLNRAARTCFSSVIERYAHHDLYLVLKVKGARDSGVRDFVFFSVPGEGKEQLDPARNRRCSHSESPRFSDDEGEKSVFAEITQVIEDIKGPIVSFVRLEAAKDRVNLRGEVLGPSGYAPINILSALPERKGHVFDLGVASVQVTDSPSSMVEAGSEMFNNFSGENSPMIGEPLIEAVFVDFMRSVRIILDGQSVWLIHPELTDFSVESVDMFLCACDPELCAIEWAEFRRGHGEI